MPRKCLSRLTTLARQTGLLANRSASSRLRKNAAPNSAGGAIPSGAKARFHSAGFMRGLKPPPPSGVSFSAACEADVSLRNEFVRSLLRFLCFLKADWISAIPDACLPHWHQRLVRGSRRRSALKPHRRRSGCKPQLLLPRHEPDEPVLLVKRHGKALHGA
jgi:hypothetical protein